MLSVTFIIMIIVAFVACIATSLLSTDTTGKELDRPTNSRINIDIGEGVAGSNANGDGFGRLERTSTEESI